LTMAFHPVRFFAAREDKKSLLGKMSGQMLD
jgi:hypothetical protein